MAVLPTLLEELEWIWIAYFLRCYDGLTTCVATAEEQLLPFAAVIPSVFQ